MNNLPNNNFLFFRYISKYEDSGKDLFHDNFCQLSSQIMTYRRMKWDSERLSKQFLFCPTSRVIKEFGVLI